MIPPAALAIDGPSPNPRGALVYFRRVGLVSKDDGKERHGYDHRSEKAGEPGSGYLLLQRPRSSFTALSASNFKVGLDA